LQANEAGVGFPTANLTIPPVPNGVHFHVIANNVDPSVGLPTDLHIGPDGTVIVPVNIDDAHPWGSTGLTEAHLALTYDPRLFTVSAADVHLGSLLTAGSGWTVTPTINSLTGEIAIALSSTTPISSSVGGSLVTIDFHQNGIVGRISNPSSTALDSTAIELVSSVNPTGQQLVTTELEDAQGTFTLTPAPSNGLASRIDNPVTLTAASVSALFGSAAPVTTITPQVVQADDSHAAEIPVLETTGAAWPAAPESGGQALVAGPTVLADAGTLHVAAAAVHGVALAVAATSSLAPASPLAAAPLAGLVIQLASTAAVNPQGPAGLAAWQHVADQLFQALVHAPASVSDPGLVGSSGRESLERAVASQFLLSGPALDNRDALWEEVGGALEDQGLAPLPAVRGPGGGRHAASSLTPPATIAADVAQRAFVDQVFAQAADDGDQPTKDE
jgi:hypothetical protein